ncbi:Myosin-3 [Trapelia coarctata]|nr:Myosin-3 [Trapelia coarctata]
MSGSHATSSENPQLWDPDKTLNIDAGNQYMFCVGLAVSRGNARCRWRITGSRLSKVCKILDEMGTKPPMEICESRLLSRLAELSLCEEQHQHQRLDVLERWEGMIADVAVQYEKIEKLRKQVRTANRLLGKEREEREELQKLLAKERAEHEMRPAVIAAGKKAESETPDSNLLMQVERLESSLTKSREEIERLSVQKTELSGELATERQALKEYKMKTRAEQVMQSKNFDNLQVELIHECRISAQREKDLQLTTKTVHELQSQFSNHREISEQLRRDIDQATSVRKSLLAQIESSRAQSAVESRSLDQLRTYLDKAEKKQAVLEKENENIQSLLAAKSDICSQLETNVKTLRADLASTQDNVVRTQLDLSRTREVNEEQAAAYAVLRAESSAEMARLIEQIRQLEKQSQVSFLSFLTRKLKGLAERITFWAMCGRRRRRDNESEIDLV